MLKLRCFLQQKEERDRSKAETKSDEKSENTEKNRKSQVSCPRLLYYDHQLSKVRWSFGRKITINSHALPTISHTLLIMTEIKGRQVTTGNGAICL